MISSLNDRHIDILNKEKSGIEDQQITAIQSTQYHQKPKAMLQHIDITEDIDDEIMKEGGKRRP